MAERSINLLPSVESIFPIFSMTKAEHKAAKTLTELQKENRISMELVPDLLSHLAWHYVDKVLAYCAENKVEAVAELTRAVKGYKKDYRQMLINKVGITQARENWKILDGLVDDLNGELTILWYTVNGEFKKHYPDVAHDTMCTDALMAMLIIEELKKHIAELRKMIRRNGVTQDIYMSRFMRDLYDIMDAYRQECELERTELIDRGLLIIMNTIKQIKFE